MKPATESQGRCRFAHLSEVRPFTGPATVFMSHCWAGRWGDLVGASAYGGHSDRIVWVDAFAVRQWPGNFLDLDFRGVIRLCTAVTVAVAPLSGAISRKIMLTQYERQEYVASREYAEASKTLPFARLWCIGQ